MGLEVTVEREDKLLSVKGRGSASLVDMKGFCDLIATICREEHRQLVLLDLLDVAQQLAFTEHLQLGSYVADRLAAVSRVASVVPAELKSGNSERAAQKSGLKLRTFTTLTDAREWLLAGS
jgi:hypothetical protein